jgi:GT2 family glycosyltransferase
VKRVGLVIPTIFGRPQYLPLAIESIRAAGDCYLILTAPAHLLAELAADSPLIAGVDAVFPETEGLSLPEKLNEAFAALPESCEYIGWLGDDDILLPGALDAAVAALDDDDSAVMVYGGCDYIDPEGRTLFTNSSSQFAAKLLSFGPQLIPQPGALWRRESFNRVGGLSSDFQLAFDFDLFLKLSKLGPLRHVHQTLAQFRWHPDSLSVKRRWVSVSEASRVRRKHARGGLRAIAWFTEPVVMLATYLAGKLVSLRRVRTTS